MFQVWQNIKYMLTEHFIVARSQAEAPAIKSASSVSRSSAKLWVATRHSPSLTSHPAVSVKAPSSSELLLPPLAVLLTWHHALPCNKTRPSGMCNLKRTRHLCGRHRIELTVMSF